MSTAAQAHLKTRNVTIPVDDGTQMPAFMVVPEHKGEMPGVIVLPEIFGVNSHIKEVAKKLAQAGYVAIAPELFHRTAPGFHASYDDMAAGVAQAKQMTLPGMEADLRAAFQFLSADPHVKNEVVGAIGLCMGGRLAFVANSIVPLRAAISFYGSGIAANFLDRVPAQHGPFLAAWGGRDAHIPLGQIRQLEDAMHERGKSMVNAIFHDADHGFLCDERSAYHPAAAEQGWALALAFLNTSLRGTDGAR